MLRRLFLLPVLLVAALASGCGYHTLGSASHLPANVGTLAVPIFQNRTEAYHTETAMTQAVIREFMTRTRWHVTPNAAEDPDATLRGTILSETVTPYTYNTETQQSSSFLVSVIVAVKLTARDGRVLYQNNNYVFRQQYQTTEDLTTFLQEDPAAIDRLSRDLARQLVADVIEGF